MPRNRANKFMLNGLKNKIFVQPTIRNTFKESGGIGDEGFFFFNLLLGIYTTGEKKSQEMRRQ